MKPQLHKSIRRRITPEDLDKAFEYAVVRAKLFFSVIDNQLLDYEFVSSQISIRIFNSDYIRPFFREKFENQIITDELYRELLISLKDYFEDEILEEYNKLNMD